VHPLQEHCTGAVRYCIIRVGLRRTYRSPEVSVSVALPLALQALWLAMGFAFVLWGLRIFKAYVALLGGALGCAAGAAAAAIFFGSTEAMIGCALAGTLVGALLAWPLQKLLVFAVAGATISALAMFVVVARGNDENLLLAAIIGFVAGGVLTLLLYDIVIIVALAFHGAQAVFQSAFVTADAYIGTPREVVERLLGIYSERIVAFAVTTLLFVGLALWYQRRLARPRGRTPEQEVRAAVARRVCLRLAVTILAVRVISAALALSGTWHISSFELTGLHALSWPLACVATVLLLRGAVRRLTGSGDAAPARARRGRRHLALALFGVTLLPALTAALFVAYGASWDSLIGFYLAFISGTAGSIAAKWTFAFGLLPLLLAGVVPAPRTVPTPTPEPKPAQPAAVAA
jgi:hypothetical protein